MDSLEQKYSHHFTDLLAAMGYTHCFFVPGGNTMHLLDSARTRMVCVPFVHEVSAAVGAEYFNEVSASGRAYVLVTAGPGITNAMTGVAGAYLESRDLLVVGGQVKVADLARGQLRQRGIQEIDGLSLAAPVCKASARIEAPWADRDVVDLVSAGLTDRRGPVFIEFCLDAQGAPVPMVTADAVGLVSGPSAAMEQAAESAIAAIAGELAAASRPVLLIGGGVSPAVAWALSDRLASLGVPLMTTWNGFDRVPDSHPMLVGRPNTWGQRSANILLAQADLIVALGTRLGIQQTGFNWQEWGPGRVMQVDVDAAELGKGHPRVDLPVLADANRVLELLCSVPAAVPGGARPGAAARPGERDRPGLPLPVRTVGPARRPSGRGRPDDPGQQRQRPVRADGGVPEQAGAAGGDQQGSGLDGLRLGGRHRRLPRRSEATHGAGRG